jgi:hypothetical protein
MSDADRHEAIASAIAASVRADLGVALPVGPRVLCEAYGWRERAHGDSRSEPGDIRASDAHATADEIERLLALTAARRLAAEAGFARPPLELVIALAERLCGRALLAQARANLGFTRFAMAR